MTETPLYKRLKNIEHLAHLRDVPTLVGYRVQPFDLTTYDCITFKAPLGEVLQLLPPCGRDLTRVTDELPTEEMLHPTMEVLSSLANVSGRSPFTLNMERDGTAKIRYFTLIRVRDPITRTTTGIHVLVEIDAVDAGGQPGMPHTERGLAAISKECGSGAVATVQGAAVDISRFP